jgi:hypothetical protein
MDMFSIIILIVAEVALALFTIFADRIYDQPFYKPFSPFMKKNEMADLKRKWRTRFIWTMRLSAIGAGITFVLAALL